MFLIQDLIDYALDNLFVVFVGTAFLAPALATVVGMVG